MPDIADLDSAGSECWSEEKINSLPALTLVRTYHVVARHLAAIFTSVNLGPTQFNVLAHLAANPRLTQAELARRVLVTPQSMGDLVAALLERGLIRKDGPGGRGRPTQIELTPSGRKVLDRANQPVMQFNEPETLGLTGDQADSLNNLLHSVRVALSESAISAYRNREEYPPR
jgi:DNA-binding MarR family transcriptional regulator